MYNGKIVWEFKTARFRVTLETLREYDYRYDGDDEDGSTQAALDCGDLVAFDTTVTVYLDGRPIGVDTLGCSVYEADNVSAFWTDHRDRDPMNRNCSIMRATRGGNVYICHYFPEMVRIAIGEARKALADVPQLRRIAA